jgi:hypothetical protein
MIIAYWPLAVLVPEDLFGTLLRVLQVAASVIVIAAYAPYGLDGLRSGHPDRAEKLALAVCMGFVAVGLNGLWFLIFRLADRPEWMAGSWVHGFTLWLVSVSSVLFISAASALRGAVHNRRSILISAIFVAGLAVFVIALLAMQAYGPLSDQ